jgi:hypothetical protein
MTDPDEETRRRALEAMARINREIDHVLEREDDKRAQSHMGHGPEIDPRTIDPRAPGNAGYTRDAAGRVIRVVPGKDAPVPERDPRDTFFHSEPKVPEKDQVEENMQKAKRELTAKEIEAREMERLRKDTPERQEAIQRHLARIGMDPDLAIVRKLFENSQAYAPEAIAVQHQRELREAADKAREQDARNPRGRDERGQEPPGRERE